MRLFRPGGVARSARSLRRSTVACALGLVGLVSTTLPVAAFNEQGTIVFTGTGTRNPYPCGTCNPVLTVATTGNIAGTSSAGVAFTLSWAAPSAPLTLAVSDYCNQIEQDPASVWMPFPTVQVLGGDMPVNSEVVFNYGGVVRDGASVDVQMTMQQISQAVFTIASVYIVVQWQGATLLNFQVGLHPGPFYMTPTNPSALCPTSTPTTIAVAGALVSAT